MKICFLIVVFCNLLTAVESNGSGDDKTFTVSGTVFLDSDSDGKISSGEKGVEDVILSDGLSVTKTNSEGRFSFTATVDPMFREVRLPVITISVPDGYKCTTGWFIRLKGNKEIDNSLLFGINIEKQTRPFEFVHVTDIHWPRGGEKTHNAFTEEMKKGAGLFRFIINTGDMGDWPDIATPENARIQELSCKSLMDNTTIPWRMTPGNHEYIYGHSLKYGWGKDNPDYGAGLQWNIFGPFRWSFNYAGVHFVGIDVMERQDDDEWIRGAPDGALLWLEKDLSMIPHDMPVYMFGHIFAGPKWRRILEKANFRGVFYGDGHTDITDSIDGVPFVESGSLGQTSYKKGYRIVRIDKKGNFEERYHVAGEDYSVIITTFDAFDNPSSSLKLKAYCYGMKVSKNNISATVENAPVKVSVSNPGHLKTGFTISTDLSGLSAGYHMVEVEVADGSKKSEFRKLILKNEGENIYSDNDDKVTLGIGIGGVDVPADVYVNDIKIGNINKTITNGDEYPILEWKQTTRFAFDVPLNVLKRLNKVEIRGGNNNGRPDQVFVTYIWMEKNGNYYCDLRREGIGRYYVRKDPQYIDLATPLDASTYISPGKFIDQLNRETHQ